MQQEEIVTELQAMLENPDLITVAGFRANAEVWPDHSIPFVADHLDYINTHRNIKAEYYLKNLRLQLRRR